MNHRRRFVGVMVGLLGAAVSGTGLGAPAADPHAKTVVLQDQKPPPLSPPPKGSVLARRVKEVKVVSVLVIGQGGFEETQLHVTVGVAGKRFLSLDRWESKVVSFHDDKGTDFTAGDSSRIYLDGPSAELNGPADLLIQGRGFPEKGATKVKARVTLRFKVGSQEKTITHKEFICKPGAEAGMGPFTLTCPDREDFPEKSAITGLKLEGKKPGAITKVEVLNAKGELLPHSAFIYSSRDHDRATRWISLYQPVDRVTVRVTYCAQVGTLTETLEIEGPIGGRK